MPEINKLNIYLIKEQFEQIEDFVNPDLNHVNIPNVGTLYYAASHSHSPEWIENFFINSNAIPQDVFLVSGASALLICKVQVRNGVHRFFAIPFGSGRFLLKENRTEDRFGLITAANLAEENSLRSIDKRVVGANAKLAREQLARLGSASDFGIDIEKDLLHGITVRTNAPGFGRTLTGKDSLSVSAAVDITNVHQFLKSCFLNSRKKRYQEFFPWIDFLKEIQESELMGELNLQLVTKIKNHPDQVWMAVPEIIEWNVIAGFKYSERKRDLIFDDLDTEKFLETHDLKEVLSLDDLNDNIITAWKSGNEKKIIYRWRTINCLNTELNYRNRYFILNSGKWYEIKRNFVRQLSAEIQSIPQSNIPFIPYNHENEKAYNEAITEALHGLCMDAHNIVYGGSRSKIELCDVIVPQKWLIHIKRYSGSSVLSHLFNQGYVSAELLLLDSQFRQIIRDHLPAGNFRQMIPGNQFRASDFHIVFAIIGAAGKGVELELPFFAKIALRKCYRLLKGFQYKVYLNIIQNNKENSGNEQLGDE
ncbi:MAG TPA: DUF6119 family protein [Puia sp.]|jgi:uncharacterized protein (TIGR04141 family)|nr:DUF6119 family protein [Puia sp.]